MMKGKTVVELAADLSAGYITERAIRENYGDSTLSSVLGIAGGVAAGALMGSLLKALDDETDIISDLGSVLDDLF